VFPPRRIFSHSFDRFAPRGSALAQIQHIVVIQKQNRSFDEPFLA
jgi:phospholipase C